MWIGVVIAAVAPIAAPAASETWVVVKRGPTAGPGSLATVGAVVRHPTHVAVRVVVTKPRTVTVTVVMSCRRRLKTGVGRSRLAIRAPATRELRRPLSGADNCALSATATNSSHRPLP